MAEPAQAEYGHEIAGPGAAVSQRVECGDAGTHQRGRLDGRQLRRQQRERAGGSDHVVPVSAVERQAGDLAGLACEEIPPTAGVAMPAMSAVPPDPYSLAWRPSGDAGANRIDHPCHLMTRNSRVLNSRKSSLFDQRIAVADAACLHLDSDRSRTRFRYRPFNEFKGPIRVRDLCNTHRRHNSSSRILPSLSTHAYFYCPQEVSPVTFPAALLTPERHNLAPRHPLIHLFNPDSVPQMFS